MAYLIAILVSLLLFAGFLWLVALEARRGRRMFAGTRAALDREAGRVEFVFAHVDFGSALRALAVAAFERIAHDIAHGVLVAVRFMERSLTGAVRTLRARRAEKGAVLPPEDAAPTALARTMQDIKAHLRRHPRANRPDASAAPTDAVE
ncbi:MAG TPA: hypothetical protein VF439_01235 [Candidatus Paceibacterota bacterium]